MSRLTAHAVDNHQEFRILVHEIVAVVDEPVPAPYRFRRLAVPARQALGGIDNRLEAARVPREFKVAPERRLDDEANVVRVLAVRHVVERFRPAPTDGEQLGPQALAQSRVAPVHQEGVRVADGPLEQAVQAAREEAAGPKLGVAVLILPGFGAGLRACFGKRLRRVLVQSQYTLSFFDAFSSSIRTSR